MEQKEKDSRPPEFPRLPPYPVAPSSAPPPPSGDPQSLVLVEIGRLSERFSWMQKAYADVVERLVGVSRKSEESLDMSRRALNAVEDAKHENGQFKEAVMRSFREFTEGVHRSIGDSLKELRTDIGLVKTETEGQTPDLRTLVNETKRGRNLEYWVKRGAIAVAAIQVATFVLEHCHMVT